MASSSSLLTSKPLQWAIGSWSLFIAENYILSENRTYLITALGGDDQYHYLYGTCSTVAIGSIGYGYRYKIKGAGPMRWEKLGGGSGIPRSAQMAGLVALSMAFGMMSQSAPKLQIPFAPVEQEMENNTKDTNALSVPGPTTNAPQSPKKWKVRCPFDFTHPHSNLLEGGSDIRGID